MGSRKSQSKIRRADKSKQYFSIVNLFFNRMEYKVNLTGEAQLIKLAMIGKNITPRRH